MSAPAKKQKKKPPPSDSDSDDKPKPKKARASSALKGKAKANSESESSDESDEESDSDSDDDDDGGDGEVSAEFMHLPADDPEHGDPEPDPDNDKHNLAMLKACVIAKSHMNNWKDAKTEWELVHIYECPGGQCICEHRYITDHCVLRNKHYPDRELVVGNVCVGKFEDEELSTLSRLSFAAFKRVRIDPENKRANKSMLTLCIRRKILGSKQGVFYLKRARRRRISNKDRAKMIKLTKKIVYAFEHPSKPCDQCDSPLFAQKSMFAPFGPYWACTADTCKTADGKMRYTGNVNVAAFPNPPPTLSVRQPVKKGDNAWCLMCRKLVQQQTSKTNEMFLACYNSSQHAHNKPVFTKGLRQTAEQQR